MGNVQGRQQTRMRTLLFLLMLTNLALCFGAAGAVLPVPSDSSHPRYVAPACPRHRVAPAPCPLLRRTFPGAPWRRPAWVAPPPGLLPPEHRPLPAPESTTGRQVGQKVWNPVPGKDFRIMPTRAGPGSESAVRKCGEFRFRVLNVHL